MRLLFFSFWPWRLVGWITTLVFVVLFVYTLIQLIAAVTGGGA